MIHQFGGFELDAERRELRLAGREIPLQPRVFDLLAYLVEHSDRVVTKDELLDAVWPGVIVTEASLQRAVSLARAALQAGDLGEAIRTYTRRGYRFCAAGDPADSASAAGETGAPAPSDGDALFAQSRWLEAADAYERGDARQGLDAAALERWAAALQCAGQLRAAAGPLERAAAAHSAAGDRQAAARTLIALARIQLEAMEPAIARGCLRRASHLLAGLPRAEPHGHLAWMTARYHLFEGDIPRAIEHAREAHELGRSLGSGDVETMGLLYWGIGLQASGETRLGVELQDEAAAAVLAGNVAPLLGGIVYCGLIAGCCNRGDWGRAEQWTESFSRWCERAGIETFAGACLLHRAEVFVACGELDRAQAEITRGDAVIRVSAPWAVGDARRLLGDLHLTRGAFDAAEQAYRDAHEHGWDPYPGYAMLLHYRGRTAEAVRGLLGAAETTTWVAGERRGCYLAHAALLSALAGATDQCEAILARLDEQPRLWQPGAAAGQVWRARAELLVIRGEGDKAITLLRRAVQVFQQMRAPLEAALARMRLAELHAMGGDTACADLELSSAENVFRRAGASWYLNECAALRARHFSAPKAG